MYDQKPWVKSKTVWGGIIALIAGVAGGFGVTVSPEEQDVIAGSIVSIATVVGGITSIYGRIKANTKVK